MGRRRRNKSKELESKRRPRTGHRMHMEREKGGERESERDNKKEKRGGIHHMLH
jgi:hypothetical protein